jgi:hypothetical protein
VGGLHSKGEERVVQLDVVDRDMGAGGHLREAVQERMCLTQGSHGSQNLHCWDGRGASAAGHCIGAVVVRGQVQGAYHSPAVDLQERTEEAFGMWTEKLKIGFQTGSSVVCLESLAAL